MSKPRKPYSAPVPTKHPETGAAEFTAVDHGGRKFSAPTAKEAEQMREDYNK